MTTSRRDKALTAIAQERITVLKAGPTGIALRCVGSRIDPNTLQRPVYRAALYRRDGAIHRECDCPSIRRCYHLEACELLAALGDPVESRR